MIPLEQLLRGAEPNSTLDNPLDHLVACHRRIEERLGTLERAADALESQREDALEAIAACFRFLDTNGILHTADEEESVFPRLRPRLNPEESGYLESLEEQHREAEQLYTELKDTVARYRAGEAAAGTRLRALVERFCRLYRTHIASEDQTLIDLGRQRLEAGELALVSREMKNRRGLAA
ncbi:MAG: hemerythrin domain-containing protein [Acidobacteria bacterium]|nr:hemerythrin domain-containing protein [Acidobacteriota bacterium]